MSASKRPSTSSLRRFITSRPYVTVAELRRRFGLELEYAAQERRPKRKQEDEAAVVHSVLRLY